MKTVLNAAKSIVYAAACAGLLLPTQTAQASIGSVLSFNMDEGT